MVKCAAPNCEVRPERKVIREEDGEPDYLCEEHFRMVLAPNMAVLNTYRELLAVGGGL